MPRLFRYLPLVLLPLVAACTETIVIPGITPESLSGPPQPPKAGGPAPEWKVEPFDDDFGPPMFGIW